MPINLLSGFSGATAPSKNKNGLPSSLGATGSGAPIAALSGFTPNGGNQNYSSASQLTVPMGQKAVSPTQAAPKPATTLPKSQAQPLAQYTPSITSTVPPKDPSLGTQHPGDPGFNPINPPVHNNQSNVEQYDAQGNPVGSYAPQQQTPPQSVDFKGLLGASVNQQNSPYNQTAQQNINQTSQYGANNQNIADEAKQIGDRYGSQIAKVSNYGNALAGSYTTGAGLAPVSQGLAGQAQNTTANEVQGLQAAENAALNPLDKELTAQNQAANASNAAAGQALTGQGQTYGALQNAYSAAKPQLGSIGQVPFNPTDQSQGQVLGSTQPGGLQAAGQMLGQFNGAQAVGAAPYQTQASNIQTAGTAGTNIAAQGASDAVQTYNKLNAANSTFDNQASQVLNVLSQGSLNGSIPDVNKAINKLGGKFGSTQVQALASSLTELGAAYTNLLSSNGGTPTAQDQQAIATLNPNSSAAQIATSIDQLRKAAQIKLQSAHALASGYGNALGSTGNAGSSTGGGVVQTKVGAVNTDW